MVDKIAWLVFIRANSSRFPGKCYKQILDKNIFSWLSSRAAKAGLASHDLFLCTSKCPSNLPLVQQSQDFGHQVLVGSERYPIQRITTNWDLLKEYNYLVRICGDSPMYPFSFVASAINHYIPTKFSVLTNTRLRNFPSGFSIEAYNTIKIREIFSKYPSLTEEEHMSSILRSCYYDKSTIVDICTNEPLDFFPNSRYTVDYPSDILKIAQCFDSGLDIILEERLSKLSFC